MQQPKIREPHLGHMSTEHVKFSHKLYFVNHIKLPDIYVDVIFSCDKLIVCSV